MESALRLKAKKDENHNEIADAFISMGCLVRDMSRVGGDFPDLIICQGRKLALIEVKTAKGRLTPGQMEFASLWPVYVVHSVEEAEQVYLAMRRR